MASQVGSGTTFHFSLPLQAAQPALWSAAPGAVRPRRPHLCAPRPLRILIAEDGEDNRLLLRHYLRGEPVTVQFAEDGQAAVDAVVEGGAFDLILMDLDMPVLSGYAATRRIREWQAERHFPSTPIIALSAHAIRELVQASLDAGCTAHVAKPLDRNTLLETIYNHTPMGVDAQPPGRVAETAGEEVSPEIAALVPQYLASKSKQLEEAETALAAHDMAAVQRFGHNLKGTGRGYGFTRIEQIGNQLERAAACGDQALVSEQFLRLREFLSEVAAPVSSL